MLRQVNTLLNNPLRRMMPALSLGLALVVSLSGCSEKMVHNRSIADLNHKAQELMQKGDAAGAVGRLESALDLNPNEPNTLYNLAIAYQANQQYDQSIRSFEALLELKQLPSNIDKAKILQSLGVVYEDKADILATKSTEALEAKKPEDAARYQADAIAAYQKAKETYEQVATTESGQKLAGKIGAQTQAIDKKIEDMQKPEQAG